MARTRNQAILLGVVGRDPDISTSERGTKTAWLPLVTSRRVQRDGGYEERNDWHRLVFFDGLAQTVEHHVRKGERIYVEGRIEYNSYEKNGVTIPITEIIVNELVMLGRPAVGEV